MNLLDYITKESNQSLRGLAIKMGYSPSTLSRQFRAENALTLETLRDISLATGLDFLDLAVRAGLITPEHATKIRAKGALQLADSQDILDELARRLEAGEHPENMAPPFQALHPTSPNGHLITPDGLEFRPDLYQSHKLLWERHGENWREHYILAAKHQAEGDDIDETYTP